MILENVCVATCQTERYRINTDLFLKPRMQEIEKRMMERGQQMKILKEKMNRVEDEVFRDFCLMLGVSNIRYGK